MAISRVKDHGVCAKTFAGSRRRLHQLDTIGSRARQHGDLRHGVLIDESSPPPHSMGVRRPLSVASPPISVVHAAAGVKAWLV
jgi:hypothetical protein